MTHAEFIEAVKGMSVIELMDLVKALEEEFGVSAAAPVAAAGAAPAAAAAPVEEQTEFNVVLTEAGCRRRQVRDQVIKSCVSGPLWPAFLFDFSSPLLYIGSGNNDCEVLP